MLAIVCFTMTDHDNESPAYFPAYEAAIARMRTAERAHAIVTRAYRAREVDDSAFLASRATVDAAHAEVDTEERNLLLHAGRVVRFR